MIRVLHICAAMNDGGIERMIMNYFFKMDREKISFDFIVHSTKEGMLEKTAKDMGARVYHVPPKSKHFIRYQKQMKQIFKEGNYDVVHCHQGYKSIYALAIAKRQKIPVRIAHAHVLAEPDGWVDSLEISLESFLTRKKATLLLACSKKAAKVWKKANYILLADVIDFERFQFRADRREQMRKALSLEKKFVVICVGRMVPSKNHIRLLQIFQKLKKVCCEACLLFVGSGPMEDTLQRYVNEENITDVIFEGSKEQVEKYLDASDVFVLPTKSEGFGMAILEAQINGLYTISTDAAGENIKISDKYRELSLQQKDEEWVDAILEAKMQKRDTCIFTEKKQEFDAKTQAEKLQKLYENTWKGRDAECH